MYWRDILTGIEEIISGGKRGALATVVRSTGSTPRHEGSKMLVFDDGRVVGTIGGGCPESEVFQAAREVIRSLSPKTLVLRYNEKDNPDGMICGGEMHVFLEPVMECTFYIFGGGHVSLAVARLCDFLGIPYAVAGEDEELLTEERFENAREIIAGPLEELLGGLKVSATSGVLIATRSSKSDEAVLKWALGRPLFYLGLLGSETKRKRLLERLERAGLRRGEQRELHCPAGVEIGAETPEEIAISIMAEFISKMRRGKGHG